MFSCWVRFLFAVVGGLGFRVYSFGLWAFPWLEVHATCKSMVSVTVTDTYLHLCRPCLPGLRRIVHWFTTYSIKYEYIWRLGNVPLPLKVFVKIVRCLYSPWSGTLLWLGSQILPGPLIGNPRYFQGQWSEIALTVLERLGVQDCTQIHVRFVFGFRVESLGFFYGLELRV